MAESERLDELFKYFRVAQDVIDIDAAAKDDCESRAPQLSQDPVLNALAQLGACRTGCERAFVSLIDNTHQYLVAEATKSTSLFDGDYHPDDGGLGFGVRVIDLLFGLCSGTMPAFLNSTGAYHISTPNMSIDSDKFVVNDFLLEEEYQFKPYVQGFPFARFYAGVPIRSNSGHVIGTYAVIDNKPRNGLTEQELRIVTEMSLAVMKHLDLLKVQTSYDGALNLLTELKSFVQGGNDPPVKRDAKFTEKKSQPLNQDASSDSKELEDTVQKSIHLTGHKFLDIPASNNLALKNDSPKSSSKAHESGTLLPSRGVSGLPETIKVSLRSTSPRPRLSWANRTESHQSSTSPTAFSQYQTLLTRAAESIRAAMRMDRVFFINAPLVATSSGKHNRFSLDHIPRLANQLLEPDNNRTSQPYDPSGDIFNEFAGSIISNNTGKHSLPDELHSRLLSQFPGGCYFNFANREVISYPSVAIPDIYGRRENGVSVPSITEPEKQGQTAEFDLQRAIRAALPSAKSMICIPLFDSESRDCPFSVVAWSSEERRVLQVEDYNYLGLFGVAIQGDFSRIKSNIQNRAKSDFISSISHELRSPLHGILGNAELLLEHEMDAEQRQMVEVIEQCGRSLLTTMNHILTHSKLSRYGRDGKLLADTVVGDDKTSESVDLSVLIEDSVDTFMAGTRFQSLAVSGSGSRSYDHLSMTDEDSTEREINQRKPLVNLTIDHCPSWSVITEPPVWARCVMNILGNALKYTEHGIIEVRLQWIRLADTEITDEAKGIAKLAIIDTGRGISLSYLQNYLYQPFLQENTSSDGLGLGLSIVKRLLDELDGSIDIQSTVGKGTTVEMSVPLSIKPRKREQGSAIARHVGRELCFIGNRHKGGSDSQTDSQSPSLEFIGAALSSTLSLYCTQWFGLKVRHESKLKDGAADVVVLFEEDLSSLQTEDFDRRDANWSTKCACIIISAPTLTKRRPTPIKSDGFLYLTPPFGPRRVATILKQAFDYADQVGTAVTTPVNAGIGVDSDTVTINQIATTLTNGDAIGSVNAMPEQETDTHVYVLVVDDNEVNVKLLCKCLERCGVAYETASDGAQAVEVFKNSKRAFDYVLMDIMMPLMTGIEATRAIRSVEADSASSCPAQIIAMTGLSDEGTRQEALASGMDKFLTKPIRLGQVKTLLQIG